MAMKFRIDVTCWNKIGENNWCYTGSTTLTRYLSWCPKRWQNKFFWYL